MQSVPFKVKTNRHEAFEVIGGELEAGVIFLCDHASNFIPQAYDNLGLLDYDLGRHIAYDIGAETVTRTLAAAFNAPAILSCFSRLLIDPNRGADDPTLIMRLSDGAIIKGNATIGNAEIEQRKIQFYTPYHEAIKTVIDKSLSAQKMPVLVSIHSFTRVIGERERPWHLGVLWDNDPRLSIHLLETLRSLGNLVVGDNQPYDGALAGDTLNIHATQRGLANTLIEVRNDLISTKADAVKWGERLAKVLYPLLNSPDLHKIKFCESRTSLLKRH